MRNERDRGNADVLRRSSGNSLIGEKSRERRSRVAACA
jgi:hypothetical protein